MGPFGFFALVLVGIYWLNRALVFFERLIGDGHAMSVFLKFGVLLIPQVVELSLPVVSFAAAIYVGNRLMGDSELVVMQASGLGPVRLLRPFFYYSILVALLAALLSHVLVPASRAQMKELSAELENDLGARIVIDGTFLHPAPGITFFVRSIDDSGALFDIFIHDQRLEERVSTYSAQRAALIKDDGKAKLIMFDGLIQVLSKNNGRLSKVQFKNLSVDLSALVELKGIARPWVSDYSTFSTISPTPAMLRDSGATRQKFFLETQERMINPLFAIVFPILGMSVLMVGGFSRIGTMRHIFFASTAIIAIFLMTGPVKNAVLKAPESWPLLYAPALVGFVAVALILVWINRAGGWQRRRPNAGATS